MERAGADSLLLSNSNDSVERTVGSGPFVSAIDSRDISWKTFHRSTAKNEESFLPNCAHVREYTSDSSLLRRALEIILEKETRRSQSFQSSLRIRLETDLLPSSLGKIGERSFRFKIRRQVYIGQHSSSSSLHDSRLLGNSINQAAISRDNN